MTAKAQRQALARHLGWQIFPSSDDSEPVGWPAGAPLTGRRGLMVLPHWPSDLNAMHGLERLLTDVQWVVYCQRLILLQQGLPTPRIACTHAGADIRCHAMLLTLNLWTD